MTGQGIIAAGITIGVSSGVPPKQFIRGEWFVTIAALTGLILPSWGSGGSRNPRGGRRHDR